MVNVIAPFDPQVFIRRVTWVGTNYISAHEYTVREWEPSLERQFERFVLFTRENGFERKFLSNTYLSVTIGEFYYWTMGAPVHETTVINRAKPEWQWRQDVFPGRPHFKIKTRKPNP